jgi:hypothetical protein
VAAYLSGSQVDWDWSFCEAGRGPSIVGAYPALTISRLYPEGRTAGTTLTVLDKPRGRRVVFC